MPSSDHNSRNYVKSSTGVWTPVGYGASDAKIPATLVDSASGSLTSVSPFGELSIGMPPTMLFNDSFETGTIDTQDRWTLAGTVPATATANNLVVQPGSTASATTTIVSQPTINGIMYTTILAGITLETTPVTGNHRFFGLGTPPSGTGTAAAPLQDAVGFEIDTAGALRGSVYAAGTRIYTQTIPYPTDGLVHGFSLLVRGDFAFWFLDSFDVPVAFTSAVPQRELLPLRVASLNSGSVSGAPIFNLGGVLALDNNRQATAIADGAFPWREAKVDATGALRTTPRSADQVATGQGSVTATLTLTLPAAGTGLYHYITRLTITKYGSGNTAASGTPLVVTSTNLPGSLGWTVDTLTANGATVNIDQDYSNPLKSSAANTATTIACPLQTNALWRVTAFYYTAP